MNLLRCGNGHYYDADKYSECPHCMQMNRHDLTQTIPEAINVQPTEPLDWSPTQDHADPMGPVDQPFDDVDLGDPVSEPASDLTVGYYANLIEKEPVVGFLVCTKGHYFGDFFDLKSGRNFIGRSRNMDVVLDMDTSVSRERHAIIIYEPRSKTFIAQAGDSHAMFYVNNEVVLTTQVLKAYDRISIGNSELMIIPCCGPEFSWEDEKK